MEVYLELREFDREMRNPIFLVRKRKREMEFSLGKKRKRESIEDPDSEGIEEEIGGNVCNGLIGETTSGNGNPNVEDNGERDEDAGNPNLKSLVVSEEKRDGDFPPDDDCCPICFENFTMACKTNCGHWFCAKCILQFWNYRAVLQKCKCPICSRLISKLTPEASLLLIEEGEVREVLKNVQSYNHLFQGGVRGFMRKVLGFPLVIKRIVRGLMDPDSFRANYYAMRSLALLLSCLYNISSFDFIPTGNMGARKLFDLCAIAIVVILFLAGIFHRLLLRRRARRLGAVQL